MKINFVNVDPDCVIIAAISCLHWLREDVRSTSSIEKTSRTITGSPVCQSIISTNSLICKSHKNYINVILKGHQLLNLYSLMLTTFIYFIYRNNQFCKLAFCIMFQHFVSIFHQTSSNCHLK